MLFLHLLLLHELQAYQKYTLVLRDLFHIFHEHKLKPDLVIHRKNLHQYQA